MPGCGLSFVSSADVQRTPLLASSPTMLRLRACVSPAFVVATSLFSESTPPSEGRIGMCPPAIIIRIDVSNEHRPAKDGRAWFEDRDLLLSSCLNRGLDGLSRPFLDR